MKPFLSTMTPEPRLRSASGALSGESKNRSKKSWKGSFCPGCGVFPLFGFSMTCVVEMFTTAGPRVFEMLENALDKLTGSGIASSDAPFVACARVARARPDISVPIRIPRQSVNATRKDASSLRFLAQSHSSRNSIPIRVLLYDGQNHECRNAVKSEYSTHSDAASPPAVTYPVKTTSRQPHFALRRCHVAGVTHFARICFGSMETRRQCC